MLDSDETFFRSRFLNRRKRQDDQGFVPFFFNLSDVTDEAAMMCQGNIQCLFDLTATGDIQLAMDTLNHEIETDVIQSELCKAFNSFNNHILMSGSIIFSKFPTKYLSGWHFQCQFGTGISSYHIC